MGIRHRKIDTGNIGHKTKKDRHGQHWAQDTGYIGYNTHKDRYVYV